MPGSEFGRGAARGVGRTAAPLGHSQVLSIGSRGKRRDQVGAGEVLGCARKHLQVHSLMLEGKEQVRYQIAVGRHHGGRHTKCVRR